MKVLKIFGVIIGILIVAAIILYFMGPGKIHIERSIAVNAPIDLVYDELSTLKSHNHWSPWQEKDPDIVNTYEGPESGLGSKVSWESENPNVGSGSMWIIEAEENKLIKTQMYFGFPGEPTASFILSKEGTGTKVVWTYDEVPKSYSKAMYALMDMEDMLGPEYEKGLQNFKQYMEAKPLPKPEVDAPMMESDSTVMDSTDMQ